MQTVHDGSSWTRKILTICVLLASLLFVSLPAPAQDASQTTMTGTVVSYGKSSLVVKTEGNHYWLFIFDQHTVKPATLAAGTTVQVISTQTEDPEVRLAAHVVAVQPPAPSATAAPAEPEVVPESIRDAESSIEKNAKKFHLGLQGGFALDPEVIDIGLLAQFGPFFSKNLQFRPSVDFGFGEISKLFALNGDIIYNVAGTRAARHSFYFGGGPQFNFTERSASGQGVSFSEFHYSTALNLLLGMRWRSGVFTEMKTSIYAAPAPIFRLMVGYTF